MKFASIVKRILLEGQYHDNAIVDAVLSHVDYGETDTPTKSLFNLLKNHPDKFAKYAKAEYPLYRILFVEKSKLLNSNNNDVIYAPKHEFVSWTTSESVPEEFLYGSDFFEGGREDGYIAVILLSRNEQIVLNIPQWWEGNTSKIGDDLNFIRRIVDNEKEVICKSRPIKKSDIIKIENDDEDGFETVEYSRKR